MGNENEMKGPCVCGCYGFEHDSESGECKGKIRDENGKYVDCDCKKFVSAVKKCGWAAENRRLDMIESLEKLKMHSSIMVYDGTMDNSDEFGKLMDEFDAMKLRVAKFKFAYRE